MRFQDPKRLIEFTKALSSSSTEALGMLSAAIVLNNRFPKDKPLTTKQFVEAVDMLKDKSRGVLTTTDCSNIINVLYKHENVVIN